MPTRAHVQHGSQWLLRDETLPLLLPIYIVPATLPAQLPSANAGTSATPSVPTPPSKNLEPAIYYPFGPQRPLSLVHHQGPHCLLTNDFTGPCVALRKINLI